MRQKTSRVLTVPRSLLLASLAALLALAGCRTLNQNVDEKLTPAEFFQRAQEASDARDFPLAMRYYQTFQRVHPEDLERNLWAAYEIAFLYHKMGDDRKAVELFDQLLERYRTEGSGNWPLGPRILAEKVHDDLLKKAPGVKTAEPEPVPATPPLPEQPPSPAPPEDESTPPPDQPPAP